MKIIEFVGSSKNPGPTSVDSADDVSTCSRDSCFFASQLEHSSTAPLPRSSPVLPSAAADAISPLSTSRKSMANLLKSTSKELDIAQFRKFPGLLANIQVTSQLLAKCLAKTTQGIDKVSNLQ